MTIPASADVVVVGAGFAGLAAARELVRRGRDVVILEGRDRVGGRSSTTTLAGTPVDLGGTFVGPTQDAVVALAAELGCETTPTFSRGKNLIRWRGKVRSYRSTIPKLSIIELLDVSRIQWRFDRVSRRVPVDAPWKAPMAEELDAKSLDEWLKSMHASAGTRDLMAIMARVTWGCEPDAVSMLHAVRYVKAAGGLDRMLDVKGGAQQDRFPGGTQQIALRMAEELGPRVVLNAVVRSIERRSDGSLTVSTDGGTVDAKAVIVAIPPEHRKGIAFMPDLPPEYGKLAQHWPQGNLSKAYAAYETPFWRANGLSGEALSDEGPVFITFDVSPGDDGPGILLGFTDSRTFDALPPAERRDRALTGFADAVRRRRTETGRLRRPLLGRRAIRARWSYRRGAARLVDDVRAVVAQTRRRNPLGRNGNRRQVDGLPRRRDPVGAACGRGSGPGAVWSRRAGDIRQRLGRGAAVLAHRLDQPAQLLVDRVGAFQDRAVAAGQFDELRQIRHLFGDPARRHHRQQTVLLAADHHGRHGQVLQPDVLVHSQRVDERAGPAAAARGRCLVEQLEDELGDRGVGVAAHRDRRDEPPARPVDRAQQRRRAERLQQRARPREPWRRPAVAAPEGTARGESGRRSWC